MIYCNRFLAAIFFNLAIFFWSCTRSSLKRPLQLTAPEWPLHPWGLSVWESSLKHNMVCMIIWYCDAVMWIRERNVVPNPRLPVGGGLRSGLYTQTVPLNCRAKTWNALYNFLSCSGADLRAPGSLV